MEGKGTTNALHALRTMIEPALEVQKEVHLCFIKHTYAFDRVRHDEIITQLTQLKMKKIYKEERAIERESE